MSTEIPKTISDLLHKVVRGGLFHDLRPYELREEETTVIFGTDSNGDPIFDNSPEMEASRWRRINAKRRGLRNIPATPNERDGD